MNNVDKLALLFEVLVGPNPKLVSRKVKEIKLSKGYTNISLIASKKEDLNLKESLDCEKIHTYLGALSLEKDIARQNETYSKNKEDKISIKELSENSKQAKKIKLYAWHNKAHSLLTSSLNASKTKLKQLKDVKFRFVSLDIVYYVYLVFSLYMTYDILLSSYRDYRFDPSNNWYNVGLLIMLVGLCFVSIVKIYTRNYAYLLASKVGKDINYQVNVIESLENIVSKQEASIETNGDFSDDFNDVVTKIDKINDSINSQDMIDYCATPKQYFASKNKKLVILYFIVAFLGIIIGALVLSALIIKM